MACVRRRCRRGRFLEASPGRGWLPRYWSASSATISPLYRLEDILARAGVYLARSTLCDWVKYAAELLSPLYELQRRRVLQSTVMWTDDTPVTVLGGAEGSFQGRFWTYIGYEQPYSVYDYTASRSRDGPASFLQQFAGYLHADAFSGYDAIYLGSQSAIREVACWCMRGGSSSMP